MGARPIMGKTNLAMNFAENIFLSKKGTEPNGALFFCLEISPEQLAIRMIWGRKVVKINKLYDSFLLKV